MLLAHVVSSRFDKAENDSRYQKALEALCYDIITLKLNTGTAQQCQNMLDISIDFFVQKRR